MAITPDNISTPEKCPILGIVLEYCARGINNPAAASPDRIDNSKGYIPGNVQVISFRANELKSDASLDELARISAYYGRDRA